MLTATRCASGRYLELEPTFQSIRWSNDLPARRLDINLWEKKNAGLESGVFT